MTTIIEKHIVDILTNELELDSDHIWIYSQNRKLPDNADGLYCMVGEVNSKVISAKSYAKTVEVEGSNVYSEIQETYEFCDIQIDLMSYSNDARDRRSEVVMALNSFYAIELMEKNNFRIYQIPSSWQNTGKIFGGSEVNMFSVVITCDLTNRKIKNTSYYDKFEVTTSYEDGTTDIDYDNTESSSGVEN